MTEKEMTEKPMAEQQKENSEKENAGSRERANEKTGVKVQVLKKGQLAIKKGNPFPLGSSRTKQGVQFAVYAPSADSVQLNLYQRGRKAAQYSFILGEEFKTAYVFSVIVENLSLEGMEYTFVAEGKEIADPYARKVTGMEKWGSRSKREEELGIRAVVKTEWDTFWEDDRNPRLPYSEVILYQLHVRGFTKHSSSKIEERGTFKGVERKIPYLKELGVTSLLLLPAYEFDEWMKEDLYDITRKHLEKYKEMRQVQDGKAGKEAFSMPENSSGHPEGKLNYWGYADKAWYFAPKTSYAYDKANPEREFMELVAALHREGMEIIMDMHFAKDTNPALIMDCLRFWVLEYHVDGFRINEDVVPSDMAAKDPVVGSVKLLATGWTGSRVVDTHKGQRNLAEFNDGFMNTVRCFLKGDEGKVSEFFYRIRRNPADVAVINYVASNNGFNLMDMVSYDGKHNEENGENGRDGTDFNFSWNCGAEGKTRKKNVLELRRKQIKNALLMLFLSQGTPMLLAGDEFGDTREGNNNPYCQDNEISWINWDLEKKNEEQLSFVKELIALRKNHRILHMPKELRGTDYGAFGYPDLSFHGTKAWYPDEAGSSRMAAVMLTGKYAGFTGGKEDDNFYIACNMHWEDHEFDLPKLKGEEKWEVLIDTGRLKPEGQLSEKTYLLKPRSVVLLTAKEPEPSDEKKTARVGKIKKKK